MPPKKICSDRASAARRETSVTTCFKRGRRVGYRGGILAGQQRGAVRAQIGREIMSRNITNKGLRELGVLAQREKIPNYGRLRKDELQTTLKRRGYYMGG